MPEVQPTNNPVPSDHPADARDNLKRIDEVVNLQSNQTNPTRTGKVLNTLRGIESKYIASPINGGVWAAGVTFTAYNQYMAFNGVTYKASFSVELPYTTQGSDPTTQPDSGSVQPFSGLNASLSEYATLIFRESGGNSPVDNMINGVPFQPVAGSIVRTLGYNTDNDGGGVEYFISQVSGDFSIPIFGGLFAIPQNITSPRQVGWTESGGEDNYNIIAEYTNLGLANSNYESIYTLRYFTTQWLAGEDFPIAFYGDSTTDGATTTGHTPSTIAGNNANVWTAAVAVNESPNAYSADLERQLKLLIGASSSVRCYNAGFDSQSLRTGTGQFFEFGNKAFHRVFFGSAGGLNNVDFSDVKGIVLSWGTSDSINLNDINTILDSYEWKMELLITECFERGIQPFIADPVYNNQRAGALVSGRDNDESVSVIESINNRLRKKFNLEKLSLRTPLETYASNAFPAGDPTATYGAKGDFGDVITELPDGVHPNDKGHRMVASYYASVIHPLIKTLNGLNEFKISAGSFYPITEPDRAASDVWPAVDQSALITRSTYFWRYPDVTSPNAFLYRLFIYCEKPMDLTYDMLSVGTLSRDTGTYCAANITNEVENVSRSRTLQVDYVSGSRTGSGSHLLLGRLDVGLNSIELRSAMTTVIGNSSMGFLRAEPYYDENKLNFDYLETSLTQFRNTYPNVEWLQNSARRVWSNKVMSRKNYAFAAQGSTDRRIKFKANTLHQRDILFNAMRNFRDFDTFDLIRISGTSVSVYKVETNISGAETETLLATATSSVNFSTITDGVFVLNIQPSAGGIALFIQWVEDSSGLLNNIVGPITMSGVSISNGGYSFGMQKTLTDAASIIVSDITDEFEH